MEGVYTRDTIPKRARQRSLSSFEGAWMRARALLTSGKPPAAYLQLRSRRPTSLSLGGERESEGGREGEGRELIREKKIRFRESTNEAFSFRRRLMKT